MTASMTASGKSRYFWAVAIVWLLAASLSVTAVGIAIADDSQPAAAGSGAGAGAAQQAPATPEPAARGLFPAQPPVVERPGFLHQLGVWWNDGFGNFDAKMKDARQKLDDLNNKQSQAAKDASAATQEALKNAAQATKDAATAVVRLPSTRLFELRDRCQVAANGARDCQTAATNACRSKGFDTGQPLGVSTSQECPARVLMSGRPPAEGECRDETFILGVVCQ